MNFTVYRLSDMFNRFWAACRNSDEGGGAHLDTVLAFLPPPSKKGWRGEAMLDNHLSQADDGGN
jgi:hypothetical protein